MLYDYKEEYFYNLLKNQDQSIEYIISVVVLHNLPEKLKQNNQPTYEYDIRKLIDDENLKEQNKTYNIFDSLYSEFPNATEEPNKRLIAIKNITWALKSSYIYNPFIKRVFDSNVEEILFELLSHHKLILKSSRMTPMAVDNSKKQTQLYCKIS